MEVVFAIIGPIVESLLVPVKKQLGYLFSSTKHVRKMNTRMKQLHDTSIDVTKHMEANKISNQEIPTHVTGWLIEVATIEVDAERISSIENGCFNLKMRYCRGRTACKTSEVIEKLIKEYSKTSWSDVQRPLGSVKSHITSTSAASNDGAAQNHFKSREMTFKDALESLQQDHNIKVIALCGMGGVGKTTMMEQLKKTAQDKKMFDYVVKVVIGQQINMSKIQQVVAEYIIGKSLSELSQEVRADRLRIAFENLAEGKNKVLVILDDIWEMIVLKDIGLSPFPNGFKLLLISRDESICTQIAVKARLAFKAIRVHVIEELEAQNFFFQITGDEIKDDQELSILGCGIVRRCGFLPLAIKLIATNLKFREANVWRDTYNNLDENIQEIIKISYDSIKKEEEKAIFMLCGLFPEDFDISIEELTRYAWGLRLLNDISTLGEARERTNTCVQNLISANLLIDSDYIGCVKMHDLVLSFVLGRVSKGDHPWVINRGVISKLSTMPQMRESCKRISVTYTGMSKYPTDFRYPNISLLRLMDGDKSLKFPKDFYERMENIEVIAYEKIQFPLLPRSLQCFTMVRTLILYRCLLMFDCSDIGELLNLEVLSFAHCGIKYLPSAIGNLEKLKLLDLTGCVDLHIDDGVLQKLVKLEELYMRVSKNKAIRFKDSHHAELAEISVHLSALEVEFFDNNGIPKNMLFRKLERFRISMGVALKDNSNLRMHSFENTLMLATNKVELLKSRMNELFKKTELLYLQVDGMNDLEEVLAESVYFPRHAFNNLKILDVFKCENLRYLFTGPIASGLMKLERLTVSQCPVLEVLVYTENGGAEAIKFQELKFLKLDRLPKLVGFCKTDNVIELPQLLELRLEDLNFTSIFPNTAVTSSMSNNISTTQPFFNKEVLIPKLEILEIFMMDKLKYIWHDILVCGFQAVETISIHECESFVNIFAPTVTNSDMRTLMNVSIDGKRSSEKGGRNNVLVQKKSEEIDIISKPEISEVYGNILEVELPVHSIPIFHRLQYLAVNGCKDVEVVFDIESSSSSISNNKDLTTTQHNQPLLLPYLKELRLSSMEGMNNVWKCNWNNLVIPQKQSQSSFHNLTTIYLSDCHSVKYLFPPLMCKLLPNLKDVKICKCDGIEEVVSNGYDEDDEMFFTRTNTISFPHLDNLFLSNLQRLKSIGGCTEITTTSIHDQFKLSQLDGVSWSLCQYSRGISIYECHALSSVISCYEAGHMQKLEELTILSCDGMKEVFETQGVSNKSGSDRDEGIRIPRLNNVVMLPNLKLLKIGCCERLEHIFPFSALESLRQLEKLTIWDCWRLKVIVMLEEEDAYGEKTTSSFKYSVVVLPRLKSIELCGLPELKGFFLETSHDFRWPSLDYVMIKDCPQMSVFTSGGSTAPQLKYMHTGLGKHSLEYGLNFHVTTSSYHQTSFPSLDSPNLYPVTSEGMPWSFLNLIELHVSNDNAIKKIIPFNELLQLQKLEKIHVNRCDKAEEVFEAGTNDEPQTTLVKLFNLRQVELQFLDRLRYIWKSNQWTVFEFPNLTTLCIWRCERLEHVFTSSMIGSLLQLQELHVYHCDTMEEVIFVQAEDEKSDGKRNEMTLPCLKSIIFEDLPCLKGFCLEKVDFSFPSLDTLIVNKCPVITTFTEGKLATPKLKEVETDFDSLYAAGEDINSFIKEKQEAYTLSEDTHVHSMMDVEVDSVLKEKFKAEAEIETEAEAKAQAEIRFRITSTKHKQKHKHKLEAETQVQPQEKVEIEAQAQTQAQAQAKTKSQAKSETETEVQAQAYSLFRRFANNSDDGDTELQKIGEDIVRKCCNLPIAIKTMALTLRNKSKNAWKDALSRLEHLDMKTVTHTVFEMSYDNLQDGETKSIFLLCGLFPKDFTIPAEELVRYGWGLKVFDGVFTIEEARRKLNTCIERLVHANLLMDGDDEGCIKMDDLVYAFVLDMLYKVDHASIINHGSMLRWREIYTSSSCQRISLTCEGMSEFPRDLKFPNLRILKLMHGDKSLRFPPDFYAEMKILQVISYYEIKYPLLHSSPVQFFFNLRVLHLHKCSLMFDCSSIGNMLNLEVLSFANSGIEWLPYTIGKLVKLRLLDLTGCVGLRIEVGVFKNLVKLEELYTIAGGLYGRAINFTDENCNEMGERSRNLSALEFEFFRNSAQLKNMSFENLERFKISVGRSFDGDFIKRKNSYENTLQLVTDKHEIIDSKVNELFKKTEVLCLNVGDISCLEDVDMKPSHSQSPRPSSFNNVRVLMVSRCEELKYVFTLDVAKALSKLEHLQVSSCDNLEELIHIDGSGEETITFPKLKYLSLVWLQNLSVLCHNVKTIELPQLVKLELDGIPNFRSIYPKNNLTTSCLLKEEVVIPELERLVIFNMENLTEIWPREFSTSKEVKLREIEVGGCDNLVNLFPCNPMIVLRHIEEFKLKNCGSIEVLFDIDLDSIGQNGEGSNNSSLKNIFVEELGKLREVWRINGADNSRLLNPNYGFQAVENIQIENCKSFHNIFTPITTNFDLGALINLKISDCGERERNNESVNYSQDKENDPPSNEDTLQITNKISNAVIPSYLIHSFHKLRRLSLSNWEGAPEVLFEIESPKHGELVTTQSYQQRLLPYLENLDITRMEKMIHVWKCNWNEFLFYQEHEWKALFHNLRTIYVKDCESIKYLFSPLMAKLLSNLKEVQIEDCGGIEKVVSEGDNEEGEQIVPTSNLANNTSYPWLDSLALSFLPNLKCIGGVNTFKKSKFSEGYGMSWILCQYCREISISYCDALSSAVAWSALGQIHKLEILRITRCDSMKEVFENHGTNNNSGYGSRSIDDGNGDAPSTSGLNHVIVLQLPMLRVLEIKDCDLLEHIFTFSTLQSLRNLEELIIWDCKAMKVIVKEEDDEEQTKASVYVDFPRLKSIALVNLPNLVGLFLGINKLVLPLLDDITIKGCPQMKSFTVGQFVAPGLKYIRTSLGKHSLEECGLNFHVKTTAQHQTPAPILDTTGSCSFQSLIELDVKSNISLERIIPSNQLLQLQNLEKIHVSYCHEVEEVFEALEGTSIGFDESQLVVKLPNLTEVKLAWLDRLRNIWNSNQWTVFEFRNLTIVSIHGCDKLEYVFTRSMVGSLLQLQELEIRNCDHMGEVVVNDANIVVEEEEEESDGNVNEIVELPHLRSLIIDHLPCLKGFCLWKVDFSFPLLDTLKINKCQGLTVFTEGHSSTPKLREIETSFGLFYVAEEDIDSFIKIKQEEFKSNRRIK